jgi:hypothetical protein
MGTFTNFPAALVPILQTGFLERELEEGLDSVLAYRRTALMETVPSRIGETLTRTRKGRKTPVTTPITPSSNTGLDNGLTPSTFSVEQYSFTMQSYADTVDVNMRDELAGIADQLIANSRNNGVQAAQSMERICRFKLFSAYLGGNTRVRTDGGAGSTTTCYVDDIRGFQNVLVNGVVTPISSANPISVVETNVGGSGVNQTLSVTAAVADATNKSQVIDGVSGTLTFTAATLPVNGDSLVASTAPKIIRPFSRATTAQLTGSDMLTMGLVEDAVAYLRDNGVPPMADGTHHCILDNTSLRQLFADQDFKILFAGRYQSREYRDGDIIVLLGITFIPTTETYVQPASQQYNGATYGAAATATAPSLVNQRVRRPIVLGAECIIQGDFEGLETWLAREGVTAIGDVFLVNGVAQILRPPLDRLQQVASLSWNWVGDFAIPTDVTATPSIIPTASSATFKRALTIEHVG